RIFGFGDLDVLTASESGIERLRMLRDAKAFKIAMLEAKHELEIELSRPTMPAMRAQEPAAAAVAAAAPAPGDSMTADEVSAAIERLTDMRDRGLITPEEFETKRKEMLARL
ncbi:MAG: SHOCT domain-containing protein, partial [Candidatus Limnocylindrales bacterium]